MWNEEWELAVGSYSSLGVQDSYDCIIKKQVTFNFNLQVRIYVNKTQNRITFKIKVVYFLKLLTPEKMKLLGSTKRKTTNYKNGKKMPHSEIIEVLLVHCNTVNIYTFISNKPFDKFNS